MPTSEYECLYTGPALSSDEAGEVQIVQDLISKGVAGIAISPSNAPAMANMLKAAAPTMPIITDRRRPAAGRRGAAQDLFRHQQLRHGRRHGRAS